MKCIFYVKMTLFLPLILFSLGCQQNMKPYSMAPGELGGAAGTAGTGEEVINDPVAQQALEVAEEQTQAAEEALLEAEKLIAELDDVYDDIGLNLGNNFQNQNGQSFTLSNPISKVLDKVMEGVLKLYSLADSARGKVEDALSNLDPNNPAHAQALEKLNALLDRMDFLREQVDKLVELIIDKTDFIMAKVDDFVAGLSMSNPLHIAAMIAINLLRGPIDDFREALAALLL